MTFVPLLMNPEDFQFRAALNHIKAKKLKGGLQNNIRNSGQINLIYLLYLDFRLVLATSKTSSVSLTF